MLGLCYMTADVSCTFSSFFTLLLLYRLLTLLQSLPCRLQARYFKKSSQVDRSTFNLNKPGLTQLTSTLTDSISMGKQESSVHVADLPPNKSVIADSGELKKLDIHLQTPELTSTEPLVSLVTRVQTPESMNTEPQVTCVQTPESLNTGPKVTLNIPESVKAALLNSLGRRKSPSSNPCPAEDSTRSSAPTRPILSPGKSGRRGVRGVAGFAGHWQFIGDAAIMNSCLKIFKVSE